MAESDVVLEEAQTGRRTGKGLVFFKNEEEVAKAKKMYNLKTIKDNRYIEFMEVSDFLKFRV